MFVCALIAAVGVIVLTLSYYSSKKSLLAFSGQLIVRVTSAAREQVRDFLSPAGSGINLTRRLAESGVVDPGDIEGFEAFAFQFLRIHGSAAMLYYGDERGNFVMVARRPDGALATKIVRRTDARGRAAGTVRTVWRNRAPGDPIGRYRTQEDPNDRYDPRSRPWYVHWTQAVSQGQGDKRPRYLTGKGTVHWTDVYVFHSARTPGITASLPYFDGEGGFRGVFGIDVALMDLSHFLAGLKIGRRGKAFILDGRRRLVAVPDVADLLVRVRGADGTWRTELRKIQDSPQKALAALAGDENFQAGWDRPGRRSFGFVHDGERYLATLEPVSGKIGSDWLVGVVVPEDDFLGDIKRTMLLTILGIGGAMLISFLLALAVSRVLARSMRKLVRESSRIRDLAFAPSAASTSFFKEVHDVLTAFEEMKSGLRSFEKYVPSKLVRLLLAKRIEPVYGGRDKELTIFFSDIRDFTPLCETMDGQELARKFGDYLSAVTDCIQNEASQGIVDKYIGDSVMAFWGAPEEVEWHAGKACRAALGCLAAVEELKKADPHFPDFHTRIGVHTARVIVGNFGSSERLNYTCIGDGVNLAGRLESLNKLYGTQVIISQDTRELVAAEFETRQLDFVAVKGRTRGVYVHELLGPRGATDARTLEAARIYEEGFSFYSKRQWDRAIESFSGARRLREGDLAPAVMIERCRRHAKDPPPADWGGLTVLDRK